MGELKVPAEGLKEFCEAVFEKVIPIDEAKIMATTLVDANLMGVNSHGVTRLTDYLNRMEEGIIERKTEIQLLKETPTTALFDANNGWGQTASVKAMNEAITKALTYGTGFVGVRNSNHFGTASFYARMAAEKNCIGIAMTNASPVMVPFGSREPSLGTNPLAIAIPQGEGRDPVLLDMATSNVARGKILLAKKNGQNIPEGWAITKDGKPTTDPIEALEGYVLPLGPKGSGLAIVIDILSGVLTGSLFGKKVPRMYDDHAPQNIGHFFGAINIDAFMDLDHFFDRVQEKTEETIASQPMEGFERVFMPGEIELEKKKNQEKEGINITREILDELKQTGEKYGVDITKYLAY